jgi:hypothetical protein
MRHTLAEAAWGGRVSEVCGGEAQERSEEAGPGGRGWDNALNRMGAKFIFVHVQGPPNNPSVGPTPPRLKVKLRDVKSRA